MITSLQDFKAKKIAREKPPAHIDVFAIAGRDLWENEPVTLVGPRAHRSWGDHVPGGKALHAARRGERVRCRVVGKIAAELLKNPAITIIPCPADDAP